MAILLHAVQNGIVQRDKPLHDPGRSYRAIGRKRLLYIILLAMLIPLQTVWGLNSVTLDFSKCAPTDYIYIQIIRYGNGSNYVFKKGATTESKSDLPVDTEFIIKGSTRAEPFMGHIEVMGGTSDKPIFIEVENVKIKSDGQMGRDAFHLDEQQSQGTHVFLDLVGDNYFEGTRGEEIKKSMLDEGGIGGAGIAVGYARIYNEKDEWSKYDDTKEACSITIRGHGKVTAIGGLGCAGIGASGGSIGARYFYQYNKTAKDVGHYCGIINILSGTIDARGDVCAAAIGDSYCGGKAQINISGGTITAKPVDEPNNIDIGSIAGIGIGRDSKGIEINITGGSIVAEGNKSPAIGGGTYSSGKHSISISGNPVIKIPQTINAPAIGIGGGSETLSFLYINISGGNIEAKGGASSAAIGTTGVEFNGKISQGLIEIQISGGKLNLKGGNSAPAIGRCQGTKRPTINISKNADIVAQGGYQSAGIGDCAYDPSHESGNNFYSTQIHIAGNPTIKAYGGRFAAGIGGGYNAVNGDITIDGGNITAVGGHSKQDQNERGGAGIGSGAINIIKKSINGDKAPGNITINGGNILARGGLLATGIGGGAGFGIGRWDKANHKITFSGGNVKAYGNYVAGVGDGLGIITTAPTEIYDFISIDTYIDENYNGDSEVTITGGNLFFQSIHKFDDDGNPVSPGIARDINAKAGYPKTNSTTLYPTAVILIDKSGSFVKNKMLSKCSFENGIAFNGNGITTGSAGEFYCYLPETGNTLLYGHINDKDDIVYRGYYQVSKSKDKRNMVTFSEGKLSINRYGKDIHIFKDGFKSAERNENITKLQLYRYPSDQNYLFTGSDSSYIYIHDDYDGYAKGGSIGLNQYTSASTKEAAFITEASVNLRITGDVNLVGAGSDIPAILVKNNATVKIGGDGYLVASGGNNAPAIQAPSGHLSIESGMLRFLGGKGAPAVRSTDKVTIDGGSILAVDGSSLSANAWEVAGLVNSANQPLKEVIVRIPSYGIMVDVENGYKYGLRGKWVPIKPNSQQEWPTGIYNSEGNKVIDFINDNYNNPPVQSVPRYSLEGIRMAEVIRENGVDYYPHFFYLPTEESEHRIVIGYGGKQYESTMELNGNDLVTLYPPIDYTLELNGITLPSSSPAPSGTLGYNTHFPLPDRANDGALLNWYTDQALTHAWTNTSRANMENGVTLNKDDRSKYYITFYASSRISIASLNLSLQLQFEPEYNGQAQEPPFTLTDGNGYELQLNTDYTLTGYANNTQASDKAEIHIEGIGKYAGSVTLHFTIRPKTLTLENVTVKDKYYDGTRQAEIANPGTLTGICGDDDVAVDWTQGEVLFASVEIGTDIPVFLSSLELSGAAKDNYILSQPIELKGNILSSTPPPIPPPTPEVYTIVMPRIEGATTDPAAGSYRIAPPYSFSFSLTLEDEYDRSDVVVLVNGEELQPLPLRSTTYSYRIDNISEDLSIEIRNVVRNNAVSNETIRTDIPKVYTQPGTLCVEVFRESTMKAFTFDGQIKLDRHLSPGLHRFALNAGPYIISIENTSWKVIVGK